MNEKTSGKTAEKSVSLISSLFRVVQKFYLCNLFEHLL